MIIAVISNPENFKDETSIVERLFEHGLEYFHLRKPGLDKGAYKDFIQHISENFHQRIIIHYAFELLDEFNLKGIHFSTRTRHLMPDYQNREIHRSISSHSFSELEELDIAMDYAFLSPVYNSISKSDYTSNFTSEQLQSFFNTSRQACKVLALGGVTLERIEEVARLGFQGIAVLGAIWKKSKEKEIKQDAIIQKFLEFKNKCSSCAPTC